MPIPDADFWLHEEEVLFRIIFPSIVDAVTEGIVAGASITEAAVAINWTLVHEQAKLWAEKYSYRLVSGITDTSRNLFQEKFSAWFSDGTRDIDDLISDLAPFFGDVRADMIAVTETTRAIFEGNMAAWRANPDVTGKRWMTSEDELVCPICGPLGSGAPIKIDGQFEGGLDGPPAHVNCRCWVEPLVFGEEAS